MPRNYELKVIHSRSWEGTKGEGSRRRGVGGVGGRVGEGVLIHKYLREQLE